MRMEISPDHIKWGKVGGGCTKTGSKEWGVGVVEIIKCEPGNFLDLNHKNIFSKNFFNKKFFP